MFFNLTQLLLFFFYPRHYPCPPTQPTSSCNPPGVQCLHLSVFVAGNVYHGIRQCSEDRTCPWRISSCDVQGDTTSSVAVCLRLPGWSMERGGWSRRWRSWLQRPSCLPSGPMVRSRTRSRKLYSARCINTPRRHGHAFTVPSLLLIETGAAAELLWDVVGGGGKDTDNLPFLLTSRF